MKEVIKLPYSEEIEAKVLGILISYPDSINQLGGIITRKTFYVEPHQIIWMVIENANMEGRMVDLVLFEEEFKKVKDFDDDLLSEIGGIGYVTKLTEGVVSAVPLMSYVKELKELEGKRRIVEVAGRMLEDVEKKEGVRNIVQFGTRALIKIQENRNGESEVIMSGKFEKTRPELMRRRMEIEDLVLTPWEGVNALLFQGFKKGGISILAGRPKMGKTTSKQNLITHWCREGLGVYNYSPEQGVELERDGLLANVCKIPVEYLQFPRVRKVPDMDEEEVKMLIMESERDIDQNWRLVVDGKRGRTFEELVQCVRQEMEYMGIDILVIDLIDMLGEIAREVTNINNVIGCVLRREAEVAQELGIHILNVWQIHRMIERKDKIPRMSDLKDSGVAEQVANLILLLFRAKYYDENSLDDSTQLIVCPQRGGGMHGIVKLKMTEPNILVDYTDDSIEDGGVPF